MKTVSSGDKVKITTDDKESIRRVARTVIQQDGGLFPTRDNDGVVAGLNKLDIELKQYSIIGVVANRRKDFYYRSIHWRPTYNITPKNSVVNYYFQEQDWGVEAWRFKVPTYRDDSGRIGVLQANASPGKGAEVRLSGRTISRVYFAQELIVGLATPDFLPLAIPTTDDNDEYGFEWDGYPFIYDSTRATAEKLGHARLIRPSIIVDGVIPEGLQLAEVELATQSYSFYSSYLNHLDETPK